MKNKAAGFTLFEILIVIVIIGIVAAGAVLTVSHNRAWQQKVLVEQIVELLTLAQEYALLAPANVQVTVQHNSLQFKKWVVDEKLRGHFVTIDESYLHNFELPRDYTLHFKAASNQPEKAAKKSGNEEENSSTILISVSGDWTPFYIWIGLASKSPDYRIEGLESGGLLVHPINNE